MPQNLNKMGLIFQDHQNKEQQSFVSTTAAYFHQYHDQFLMDCLETFTKVGLIFWDDQNKTQQS